ncbi:MULTISPECIES: hypothetical protein [unclassified Microbacterium]
MPDILTYLFVSAVSLLVLFFLIRAAVLSALNAHADREREIAVPRVGDPE